MVIHSTSKAARDTRGVFWMELNAPVKNNTWKRLNKVWMTHLQMQTLIKTFERPLCLLTLTKSDQDPNLTSWSAPHMVSSEPSLFSATEWHHLTQDLKLQKLQRLKKFKEMFMLFFCLPEDYFFALKSPSAADKPLRWLSFSLYSYRELLTK